MLWCSRSAKGEGKERQKFQEETGDEMEEEG
jgi:hypothetical protein